MNLGVTATILKPNGQDVCQLTLHLMEKSLLVMVWISLHRISDCASEVTDSQPYPEHVVTPEIGTTTLKLNCCSDSDGESTSGWTPNQIQYELRPNWFHPWKHNPRHTDVDHLIFNSELILKDQNVMQVTGSYTDAALSQMSRLVDYMGKCVRPEGILYCSSCWVPKNNLDILWTSL